MFWLNSNTTLNFRGMSGSYMPTAFVLLSVRNDQTTSLYTYIMSYKLTFLAHRTRFM